MKLTSTITFSSFLAFGMAQGYYGILSMTSVDKSFIYRGLELINGTLHEGEYSTFYVRDDGTIESHFSGEIMGVYNGTKISFSNHEGPNVSLANHVSEGKWMLQANGTTVFQRCGDGSIGLNSDCQGAKQVYLHFFSVWSY